MGNCCHRLVFAFVFAASAANAGEPDVHQATAKDPQPPSESQNHFVLANTLWTLVHEMGHALISELEIPVLGNEEDAADQIATIALLHGAPGHRHGADEALQLADAAEAWRLEWMLDQNNHAATAYWDNHPLDIQRYYNILCLLYGFDPDLLADRPDLKLPGQRALSCDDYEYEQATESVRKVVALFGGASEAAGARVLVQYEQPSKDEHMALADLVRQSGIGEHVATQTEKLFAMPHDIKIIFGSCLGDASAFWRIDTKEIVICYDLLERFVFLHQVRSCLADKEPDSGVAACLSQ